MPQSETDRSDDSGVEPMVDAVRRFVREVLIPAEHQVEEDDDIPKSITDQLGELGLFGMTIPEKYDGLGLTMYEEARVVFEIGYASPVFRSYFGTSNGVGTLGILADGTEEQRQKYLPKIAKGKMLASFCLTEPDAGSDAAALSTRAVRDGDHYVISGTKRFTTNSPHAGVFTVFARTAPKEAGPAGISAFLVDAGLPGLTVAPHYKKMGFRGSHTADVIFENCRVPASALLGEHGLDHLEVGDGLAELAALGGVAHALVNEARGEAHGHGRHVQARMVEGLHRGLEAHALFAAEQRGSRHAAVLEDHVRSVRAAKAHFLVVRRDGEAR